MQTKSYTSAWIRSLSVCECVFKFSKFSKFGGEQVLFFFHLITVFLSCVCVQVKQKEEENKLFLM